MGSKRIKRNLQKYFLYYGRQIEVYIVISQKQTIVYDEEKCLINQKEYSEKDRDGKPSKAFAEEKQKDFYLTLFQRHFPNVVVLTAAGTSMDNDNGDDTSHRGKTREGLCNACKKEIVAFSTEIEDFENKPLCTFESHEKRCIEPGIVLFALPLVTMEVKS